MGRALLIVAVLGAAAPVRAEPARFGVMTDLGLPDGMVAAFAYRPHRVVTTHLGLGHNGNGLGLRAGAALAPWPWPVAPYLALEAGVFFVADTPAWLQKTASSAGLDDKTLERVGYGFVNAHLGVRLGRGPIGFYLQGGVSFVDATADYIKPKPTFIPPVDLYRETEVHVWIASGHAGLLYTF